jgi:hypothetical protein
MFSAIHRRLRVSPAMVLAFVALIFAMTGGAFAASSGGGKGSKATASATSVAGAAKAKSEPKGKVGPRGPAGAKGAMGATGAVGATGPAGAAGPAGPAGGVGPVGPVGVAGAQGERGVAGAKGATGSEGKPGVIHAGETLPVGASETGAWSAIGPVSVPHNGSLTEEEQETRGVQISFTVPVAQNAKTVFMARGATSTECPGTEEKPEAKPGFLCVYATQDSGIDPSNVLFFAAGKTEVGEASSTGAVMKVDVTAETGETTLAFGTWAVTA